MNKFCSKIILFGEYAVLNQGKLLALPNCRFSGSLKFATKKKLQNTESIHNSNRILKELGNYLYENNLVDLSSFSRLKNDLESGLYFDSNIPQGYGAGSSGALSAAIFDEYILSRESFLGNKTLTNSYLQKQLAKIESFFHGQSSGADPIISYLNKPIVLNGETPSKIETPNELTTFLIDSKLIGKTDNLVKLYNQKSESNKKEYVLKTNTIIDNYLNNDPNIFNSIKKYSLFQKSLLPEMYVSSPEIDSIIDEFNDDLVVKICGSGGGGFLLGFCKKNISENVYESFKRQNITVFQL